MCQSVPPDYDSKPLSPHDYPIWVKGFGAFVLVVVLASFVSVPQNIAAGRQIRSAEKMFRSGQFNQAASSYQDVLSHFPASEEARLGAAESYFALKTPESNEKGLSYLRGLKLGKYDVERLTKVMPEGYWDYFKAIDKKHLMLDETVGKQ